MQQFGVVQIGTFQNCYIDGDHLIIKPFSDLSEVVQVNVIDFLRFHLMTTNNSVKLFASENNETHFGFHQHQLVGAIQNRPFNVDFKQCQIPVSVVTDRINEKLKNQNGQIEVSEFNKKYEFDGCTLQINEQGLVSIQSNIEGLNFNASLNSVVFFPMLCGSLQTPDQSVLFQNESTFDSIKFPMNIESSIQNGTVSMVLKGISVPSTAELRSDLSEDLKQKVDKAHTTFLALNEKATDGTLLKISFDLNKLNFAPKLVAESVSKSAVALMQILNAKNQNHVKPKAVAKQAQPA